MQVIYNFIVNFVNKLFSALVLVLPTSPFQKFIKEIDDIPWLGVVNYFIPIGTMLSIFLAWLTAMGLFYLYSILMRWIKIVGE